MSRINRNNIRRNEIRHEMNRAEDINFFDISFVANPIIPHSHSPINWQIPSKLKHYQYRKGQWLKVINN